MRWGVCSWTLPTGLLAAALVLGCAPPASPPGTPAAERKAAEAKPAPEPAPEPEADRPKPAPKTDPATDADEVDDLLKQLDGDAPAPVPNPEKTVAKERPPAPPAAAPRPPSAGPKAGMPAKVQLPRYFDQLSLTAEQTDRMSRLARNYDQRLAELRRRLAIVRKSPYLSGNSFALAIVIKKLTAQRQQALEKLLTDEQRDDLRRLRAANGARDAAEPPAKGRGS